MTDTDVFEDYIQVWECPAPVMGSTYRVIRDRWSEDYTVRTVLEITGVQPALA